MIFGIQMICYQTTMKLSTVPFFIKTVSVEKV